MTGEEIAGPAGPKVLRMLYFVGAGFLSVAAINKWLELERKALLQKPEENQLPDNSAKAVQKAIN